VDTFGVSACQSCPATALALEGSTLINDCKCPVGTYLNSGDSTCTACGAGLISPIGSTLVTDCVCAVNEYQDSGVCVSCPSGSISPGVIDLSGCICAIDSYMDVGTSTCIACDAGFVAVSGSTDVTACTCAVDTYLDGGTCSACPVYSSTNGATGAVAITECACEVNRVFDAGLSTCPLVCPADMITVPTGDINVIPFECAACPINTFAGGSVCVSCPEHGLAPIGSSSVSDCACIPGTQMNTTTDICDLCGIGNYCAGIYTSPSTPLPLCYQMLTFRV
jgi:hypothetical protein